MLKLVAASGQPHNDVGYLVPIFDKGNGKCFEAGKPVESDFSSSALSRLANENSVIRFEHVRPRGADFGVRDLRKCDDKSSRYGYTAYIMYFSQNAVTFCGGWAEFKKLASVHNATHVRPKDIPATYDADYTFLLIGLSDLQYDFIPNVLSNCEQNIKNILASRICGPKGAWHYLVENDKDQLARAAQFMMSISDKGNIHRAIKYYSTMLLLSPMADNFRVWIDLVLSRWKHLEQDVEYWKKRACGVLDAVEWAVASATTGERIRQKMIVASWLDTQKRKVTRLDDSQSFGRSHDLANAYGPSPRSLMKTNPDNLPTMEGYSLRSNPQGVSSQGIREVKNDLKAESDLYSIEMEN